jgi:hypothetical protein
MGGFSMGKRVAGLEGVLGRHGAFGGIRIFQFRSGQNFG